MKLAAAVPSRILLLILTARTLVTAFVLPGSATAEAAARSTSPDQIALPDGFAPEGIAIAGNSGSRVNGDIYAADLGTGRAGCSPPVRAPRRWG